MEILDPDSNLLDNIGPGNDCCYYTVPEFHNLGVQNSKFSLINYNIRSFHKNGPSFKSLVETLDHKFTCIVLSETWNNESNLDLCKLQGYESFHVFRPDGHVYSISGGISIFCEENLSAMVNKNLSICTADSEICVVDLVFQKLNFTIIAVYRPNQGCKQNFILELNNVLNSINIESRVVSVVGDFNLNLNDLENADVIEFTSLLHSKCFISMIDKPTRFPSGSLSSNPSILDMIWTNSLNASMSGILDFDTTDHLPTFFTLDIPIVDPVTDKIKIQTRPYSDQCLEKFCVELSNINWNDILDYNDLESCVQIFLEMINSLYCNCFPLKTKFISPKRYQNKWITPDVKRLINLKSESFRNYRRGLITKEENNRLKNHVNSQVNKAKHEYYITAFENSKNNSKKTWDVLGQLMGKNKSKMNNITLLGETGETNDSSDVANIFANYFKNIGQNLDSNLTTSSQSPFQHIARNPYSFYFFPVTTEECLSIISELKITSVDYDQIPVKIFKSISEFIVHPIVSMVNSSFQQGNFPSILKFAKITPIYKKDCKKLCSNYRPISRLHYLGKIFERMVSNRVTAFFDKFHLFNNNQYGFRKKRSTQDAVLNFTEAVYDALNGKNHNISVLIDLKSAFDTVNHQILLKKLELYGIRGNCLAWFQSYLRDRQFKVGINKIYSAVHTINIGIPQGSILGPLLFIIYNNDLPLVTNVLKTTLFADDTNFSIEHKNYDLLIPTLNSELSKISNWTVANRLTINTSKTEMLFFSHRRNVVTNDEHIVLNDECINFVNHARFLGVIIDNKINFKNHINFVTTKLSKHAGILYKIRNDLTMSARLTYYNHFVLPYLNFNIIHWGNTNDTHLLPLVKIQKKIIRNICNADFLEHTTPLFYRLKILKLCDVYKFNVCLDTHTKLQKGLYRSRHGLQTRYRSLAVPKFHRLTRTQQSVTFSGPTIYNELPEHLRSIGSRFTFKRRLKEFFLAQYDVS